MHLMLHMYQHGQQDTHKQPETLLVISARRWSSRSTSNKCKCNGYRSWWIIVVGFTVQLHVMQRTVLLRPFCPSVKRVDCYKTKETC